jgi:site-specific DNA-methyltransferase (adenine-specific)
MISSRMTARLFHGDCLEVMKDLSANSIDCFICDLPYGCLTGGGGKEKKAQGEGTVIGGCAWDIPLDLTEFWTQVKRLSKDEHTPVLMFCTTKFGIDLINSNPKWFRYDLIWDKGRGVSFLSANKMPMRSHEMIYVFSKAGASYNRVDISGNFPAGGGGGRKNGNVYGDVGEPHKTPAGRRCVLSVIPSSWKDSKKSGKHPTEKPIELYKFLIERYNTNNDFIY